MCFSIHVFKTVNLTRNISNKNSPKRTNNFYLSVDTYILYHNIYR